MNQHDPVMTRGLVTINCLHAIKQIEIEKQHPFNPFYKTSTYETDENIYMGEFVFTTKELKGKEPHVRAMLNGVPGSDIVKIRGVGFAIADYIRNGRAPKQTPDVVAAISGKMTIPNTGVADIKAGDRIYMTLPKKDRLHHQTRKDNTMMISKQRRVFETTANTHNHSTDFFAGVALSDASMGEYFDILINIMPPEHNSFIRGNLDESLKELAVYLGTNFKEVLRRFPEHDKFPVFWNSHYDKALNEAGFVLTTETPPTESEWDELSTRQDKKIHEFSRRQPIVPPRPKTTTSSGSPTPPRASVEKKEDEISTLTQYLEKLKELQSPSDAELIEVIELEKKLKELMSENQPTPSAGAKRTRSSSAHHTPSSGTRRDSHNKFRLSLQTASALLRTPNTTNVGMEGTEEESVDVE